TERRLAAPRLADEAERLAWKDLEGDVVDRMDAIDLALDEDSLLDREVLPDVLRSEECAVLSHRLGLGRRVRRGHRASASSGCIVASRRSRLTSSGRKHAS